MFKFKAEASHGACIQTWNCERDKLWVRFQLEEMKYLIFAFVRFDVETKHGVPPLNTQNLQNSAKRRKRKYLNGKGVS